MSNLEWATKAQNNQHAHDTGLNHGRGPTGATAHRELEEQAQRVRESSSARNLDSHHSGPWRNRIVGAGVESVDHLLANPRNFRIHPREQQEALAGVLRDVGVVAPIVVNRLSGFIVDGHLRVSLALRDGQPDVPVVYVELSPAEEAEILATFDPIGAMAATDREQLDALLREVNTGEAAVQAMLSEMAEDAGIGSSSGGDKPVKCKRCPEHCLSESVT